MNNCIICLELKQIKSTCNTCIDSKICFDCKCKYNKNTCPICKKILIEYNFIIILIILYKNFKFFIIYGNIIYNLNKLENLIISRIDLTFDLINSQV